MVAETPVKVSADTTFAECQHRPAKVIHRLVGEALNTTLMIPRVLRVEETPNPNARKFVLDRVVTETPRSHFSMPMEGTDPASERILKIPGVTSVLILKDFVTVNKLSETKWPELVKQVKAAIEHKGW